MFLWVIAFHFFKQWIEYKFSNFHSSCWSGGGLDDVVVKLPDVSIIQWTGHSTRTPWLVSITKFYSVFNPVTASARSAVNYTELCVVFWYLWFDNACNGVTAHRWTVSCFVFRRVWSTSALFWDTTQHIVAIPYRRFGNDCPETSARNYHHTPHNISEERRSPLLPEGSLNSQSV
jgi:hypothetical protein